MNVEALLKLKEVLLEDSASKPRFNMEYWFNGDSLDNICGTSACAAGTAALHPWFKERGLNLRRAAGQWVITYPPGFESGFDYSELDYDALDLFFDFPDEEDVWFLFDPGRYPTSDISVHDIINRIDELLKREGVTV